jgi:hypothetical protein
LIASGSKKAKTLLNEALKTYTHIRMPCHIEITRRPVRFEQQAVEADLLLHNAGDVPGLGHMWEGVSSSAMDFQNAHQTIWCGFANRGSAIYRWQRARGVLQRGQEWWSERLTQIMR